MFRSLTVVAMACMAMAFTALTFMGAPGVAHAEKRLALVIGNDRYANLAASEQLQKAVNDARAVGKALEQIGFEVMSGENVGRLALVDKLDAFARRLAPGDMAFFFFSGHGVSLSGANYILPADVPNVEEDQETRLARVALSEHDIVSDLQARGVRVAVVVLDACRTNPFARPGGKGVGGERGLAPPPQVKGVFSLYAASRAQAARDRLSDDDRDPNSVFSRVLVPALTKPGLDLTALAFEVREEVARVAKSAGYLQEPSYYDGTIGGRVYLAGAPPVREQTVTPAVSDAERTWVAVQNTTSLAVLDEFLRQFANAPIYGALARERREKLAKEQVREPVKEPANTPAAVPQTASSATPPVVALPVYPPPPVDQTTRGDAINTVRAFYAALSQADGLAAAALIVPEKRGPRKLGDPTEMTKFWSSLRQRLVVQRIEALSDDVVTVTYNFIGPSGKACDTTATVKTIRSGGTTFIQSISASC
jgi:hypothetical protein